MDRISIIIIIVVVLTSAIDGWPTSRSGAEGLRYADGTGCDDTVLKVMDNWSDECPGNCFRDQYGGSINDSSADAGWEWNISFPPKRGCKKYIQGRVWRGWFPFLIWGGTSAKKGFCMSPLKAQKCNMSSIFAAESIVSTTGKWIVEIRVNIVWNYCNFLFKYTTLKTNKVQKNTEEER